MDGAPRRRRGAPILVIAGLGAAALLALGTLGTLSGFTASIDNTNNTIASGTLLMEEDSGALTCLSTDSGSAITTNAGTCSTINKFGGSTTAVPGTAASTTVTIKNNGTIAASTFTLTPAGCTQSNNGPVNGSATDFCAKVLITIQEVGKTACVYPANPTTACPGTPTSAGTLTSLGTGALSLSPVAAGGSAQYTFHVMIDSAVGNSYQGLGASDPLLWQFAS